ncbi:DNA topoisomerase 2, partial [Massospora cicadina]
VHFEPMQDDERQLIDLAFNKNQANAHRDWLRKFHPDTFIDQSGKSITYADFINKELVLFFVANNIRSIPSIVNGLKPSQRKVVYDCFLWPDAEFTVTTLVSSIKEKLGYHHED